MQSQHVLEPVAEHLEAGAGTHVRRLDAPRAGDEEGGHAAQQYREEKEPAKAQIVDHDLARDRSEGGAEEAREAVDAERPAAALHGHQAHHVHVVGHEERGEADPLEHAQEGQERQRLGDDEARGGDHQEDHAQDHEGAPPHSVEPEPDHGLAEDADRAVGPLHDPDLPLGAAQPVDVEGKQDEAVEAGHEEEAGEGRLGKGPAEEKLRVPDHVRCGPLSPRRRMAATMIPGAVMIRVECSTRST